MAGFLEKQGNTPPDDGKMYAQNQQVLAQLSDLVKNLGAQDRMDEAESANIERLREEGRGT